MSVSVTIFHDSAYALIGSHPAMNEWSNETRGVIPSLKRDVFCFVIYSLFSVFFFCFVLALDTIIFNVGELCLFRVKHYTE
jgi:hypothetical protein